MAIKLLLSSKQSPFYLEADEPPPGTMSLIAIYLMLEIETWMHRNNSNPPKKKKPSEVIEFSEGLFPFELLPPKMQQTIKKKGMPHDVNWN